jgi:hypothetical protein
MNLKKVLLFCTGCVNAAGIIYLLLLGSLYMLAQDDHASLTYFHKYGFNSAFLYWYSHWTGRFTTIYFINSFYFIMEHGIPLLTYYAFILFILICGIYKLLRNALVYIAPALADEKALLVNAACFAGLISVYSNFEFNTFYWLVASITYIGSIAFFLFGTGEAISKGSRPLSFLLVGISFIFVGGASENFAFTSIVLISLLFIFVVWNNRGSSFQTLLRMPIIQKTTLAIFVCGVAFLIMVVAPGNKVRMQTINMLFAGYKKVPVPFGQLPGEVFLNYKILLALVLAKLPLFLGALPLFIAFGALSKPVMNRTHLRNMWLIILSFCLLLFVFITPTVYASASLGPPRSLSFVVFFSIILIACLGFVIGNIYSEYRKALSIIAIGSLIFWSAAFLHDIEKQVPQIRAYNTSEKSRLVYLALLKERHTEGVVVVDSLYTPHFKSYTNVFRNQIMDVLKRHNLIQCPYSPIEFDPIYYDEISADTSNYTNVDLRNDLQLPFTVQLKR